MLKTFVWCAENQFELLVDGPAFFPRMLQAIDQASMTIDLEMYLVCSGACANAPIAGKRDRNRE